MVKITREVVEHVALLARLELSEAEKVEYTRQLNQILEHMDKLNELATDGIEPTFYVLEEMRNVLRPDVRQDGLSREEALENAPEREAGCFKVPPVIEYED